MPRTPRKKATEQEAPAHNSLVASAARMTARRRNRPRSNGPADWQAEAWRYLDTVGELAFATQWVSNALSRVRIRVMEELPSGEVREVPEDAEGLAGEAVAALRALFDGDTGQPQMMREYGVHMTIPGETYLVGVAPEGDDGRDAWRILSNDECKENPAGSGKWEIDRGDGEVEKIDTVGNEEAGTLPTGLVIRIWRSHPRKHVEATSPVRAALPILRELEGLTKHVASSIDSRLAGAGLLLVPQEMTFQTPLVDGAQADPTALDDFMAALTEAIAAALTDPGSASARVPIVVKAPGEFIQYVQHITFDSPLSQEAQSLREEAIRRLALSIDLPPEVLLGQADSNHWSAWLISEDAIKVHIEPLVELMMHALTTRYLWPAMQGMAPQVPEDVKRYSLDGDTSALRQRPNKTAEAQAMHAGLTLTDDALARETGFDKGDLLDPTSDEFRRRILVRIAQGSSPDLAAAALVALGGPALELPAPPAVPGGPVAAPEPTAPAPVENDRTPPQEQAAALLAASEVLVLRAVEKGWNRAGRRGKVRKPVATTALDDCLRDAWDHVPRVAALCGVDAERLTGAVDHYARALLTTGADHDPSAFAALLSDRVLTRALGAA